MKILSKLALNRPQMPEVTDADRRELRGLALEIFMPLAGIAGGGITTFFVLSLLSWFDIVGGGTAYLLSLVLNIVVPLTGLFISYRLFRAYNEEQAHRRVAAGESYQDAYFRTHFLHYGVDFMLLKVLLGLLVSMMDYKTLTAYWCTCGLMTAVFVAGCIVMWRTHLTTCRWRRERLARFAAV